MMIPALFILLMCELTGDVLHRMLALRVPGPVIGMSIVAAALAFGKEGPIDRPAIADGLERTAETLIRHMGLLFVPAGVGLIAEIGVLRSQWLPIAAGLVGSTLLSLAVTGLVMHWSIRRRTARRLPDGVQGLERLDRRRTVANDCN
jgi:holin-like protein